MPDRFNLPWVQALADFRSTGGPPNLLNIAAAEPLDGRNGRIVERFSTSRGRQYELGTASAGTLSVEVVDPQETLNPVNTASPLNSGGNALLPYRGVGIRAFWPREGNWLDPANFTDVAGGYHPSFEGEGITNSWSAQPAGPTFENVTASPHSGTRCLKITATGTNILVGTVTYAHMIGKTYTYSVWVKRDAASPGSIQLFANDAAGIVAGASTTSTAWTQLTVTWAPTRARTSLFLQLSGASSHVVYVDDELLNLGTSPIPWQVNGPVRQAVFTGYVERYPQTWINNGYLGVRPLEAVDAQAVLSRTNIQHSYRSLVEASKPQLYIPLDDASAPPKVYGPLGQTLIMRALVAPKGGNVSWGGDTMPDGTKAVTLSQEFVDPAELLNGINDRFTELDVRPGKNNEPSGSSIFSLDTTGCSIEVWYRAQASEFCVMKLQNVMPSSSTGEYDYRYDADANTHLTVQTFRGNGPSYAMSVKYGTGGAAAMVFPSELGGSSYIVDTDWHHFVVSLIPTASNTALYSIHAVVDGVDLGVVDTGQAHTYLSVNSIHSHASTYYGDAISKGSLAQMAFYNRRLPVASAIEHYQRGMGYVEETADQRATRLLTKYWAGAFTVKSGSGLTLGPDHATNGQTVGQVLDEITQTDEGLWFADTEGRPVVTSRMTRHLEQPASTATFGEDTAGGELPYEDLQYDFDPTYLYSEVQLSRPGRSDPIIITDPVVEAVVGKRVYSRSISVNNDWDLEQAALYYSQAYGVSRMRVRAMRLQPDSKPELWPIVLSYDIGRRVTVNRRTAAGVLISGEFYIESVKHDVDMEASSWSTTWELSPVMQPSIWVLGDATRGVLGSTTTPVY